MINLTWLLLLSLLCEECQMFFNCSLIGIAASFAGKAYGQIGQGLPVAASAIAVIMGLKLLEVGYWVVDYF